MRILIANSCLGFRSGSEVHTRDLALALRRRGHDCAVYVGLLREDDDVRGLRAAGVEVTDRLDSLRLRPEIIHGHHWAETVLACARFPETPALQVCHDARSGRDRPASKALVQRWAAVDDFCRERYAKETGLSPAEIASLPNAVDLGEFPQRAGERAPGPLRAVLFHSHRHTDGLAGLVGEACRAEGVALEIVGPGEGGFVSHPGEHLRRADIVLGKARCALEAMASGAHAILLSPKGLGPAITADNFDALRRRNFGQSLLTAPLRTETLRERLRAFDPDLTAEIAALTRERCDTAALGETAERLHREVACLTVRRAPWTCRWAVIQALTWRGVRRWKFRRSMFRRVGG